jgi:alpha-tubulin suppressor-like RCC1 family protein
LIFHIKFLKFGQLGDGTTWNKNSPTLVLNQNYKVKQMSAGNEFSLILTTEGTLYSFGINSVNFYFLKSSARTIG